VQKHIYAIAEACKIAGLSNVIICPGSRSAPLVYAFATDDFFSCHSIVDERSAAYMALGMAQQTQKATVLICTSGTAAANFLPAVCEAFFQRVPLVVLTADRPPHLLHQQDGQMIDQRHLYGKHVKSYSELPCYVHGTEQVKSTYETITAAIIQSHSGEKGPVHINVPMAEPLYSHVKKPVMPFARHTKSSATLFTPNQTLQHAWESSQRKLILIGQHTPDTSLFTALHRLQNDSNSVLFSDILSNQHHENEVTLYDTILTTTDFDKLRALQPDFILSAGGPVLSKALKKWLQQCKPAYHFRIDEYPHKVDTYSHVTHSIKGNPADVLNTLIPDLYKADVYKQTWLKLNELAAVKLHSFIQKQSFTELAVTQHVLNCIPDACNVHLGSSGVIRFASWLGHIHPSWVMNGNRGTSGIDGNTSTAVGAARINNRLTFLLTGDVAFFYDIHPIIAQKLPNNLKIVVYNNHGGRIFEWIDGPSRFPNYMPYFTTPHQVDIKHVCSASGIFHQSVQSHAPFRKQFDAFIQHPAAAVLELQFDPKKNLKAIQQFKQLQVL
jgi:2-succinyl-5-enolpyruvyl-6-hydroxy-3-cyclohexene-1-carboxylate synthase